MKNKINKKKIISHNHQDMSTIGLPIHHINLINKSIEKEIEEEKDPPIHIGGGTGK